MKKETTHALLDWLFVAVLFTTIYLALKLLQ